MSIFFMISFIGVMIYFFWSFIISLFNEKKIEVAPELTNDYTIFLLIPMLNEKEVINKTLKRLVEQNYSKHINLNLVIIDDDSDDGTTDILKDWVSKFENLIIPIFRCKPNAREGKGEALNEGLKKVKTITITKKLDPRKVIIGIIDADAYISSENLAEVVKVYESNAEVTMVQTVVAMNNTSKWLHMMQDLEFQACNYLIQNSRNHFSNSAASGNGQFFCLDKLAVHNELWGNALLEDFEFSTRLLLDGKQTVFLPTAHVYQEPVSNLSAFWKQRSRWAQGGIQCLPKYGKQILTSKKLSKKAKFEMLFYMILPYITSISFIGHLVAFDYQFYQVVILHRHINKLLFIIIAISILISLRLGILYSRRVNKNWLQGVLFGLTIPIYNFILVPATYQAIFRHIIGKVEWEKTIHGNIAEISED